MPEKDIVFTEENAEIDITNLVPEKVEWKYYKNIVVDYELTKGKTSDCVLLSDSSLLSL